ncbi:MAG: SelT/SelW/SelH family protein [Daejeonella sp.]|uniref:SelT/SelW/SelH family protein n=1 Tax=Daejeonella sp. JGW-45 TaxID=3034148 RepID=UPI0023ED7F85|nr:SelT/SelW/SelH family protein [Daejeonella sp. JGW-45]
MKPLITIEYCPKCGWMLRSAYMAQELLTTFTGQIRGVTLVPAETGGTFLVSVDEKLIFDRKDRQRFPEIKELKRLVRDVVSPDMDLGHTDRHGD